MNVEEMVRESLQRAGQERHVDIPRLHESTKRALLRPRPKRERSQGWRPLALGVAAAVVVIGGVVVLPNADLPGLRDLGPAPSGQSNGHVDDEFSCPITAKTRFPNSDDDSFLPRLTEDLKPDGEAAGAPRWETAPTTSGAILRLGNADGTLASVTRLEELDGKWQPELITKCINGASPSAELVQVGLPPEGPNAFSESNLEPGSVRVVDRLTYDVRGLEKRWTLWAEPCGRSVCLKAGTTNSNISGRLAAAEPKPEDATNLLADPDDMVGQDLGLRLVVVYDREDTLDHVGWNSPGGNGHSAAAVRGGWSGQLFVFLAPDPDLQQVWLSPKDGAERFYQRGDFLE